jgi:surfactin synthase thioesterase subunit
MTIIDGPASGDAPWPCEDNQWLWDLHPPDGNCAATIVVLPHAGGSAHNYSDWAAYADPDVRVLGAQYPGRGARHSEPLPHDVRDLAGSLADELSSHPGPIYVFGHSLGALIGFELVWRLERQGQTVGTFFASACRAPHLPNPHPIGSARMSDDELVAVLRRRGGTAAEILANAELRRLVLRIVRSDFAMDDEYAFGSPIRRLECPVVAIGGLTDPQVRVTSLERWRDLSMAAVAVHTLRGGHFYFLDQMPALMSVVSDGIRVREGWARP